MQPFEYIHASGVDDALEYLNPEGSLLKAGGVDLLDLMKEGLVSPKRLVNLRDIPGLKAIKDDPKQGLTLGPLVTLGTLAASGTLDKSYRAIAQAAGLAATPQIRNSATLGGNLCQRPRCWYFRSTDFHCLRKGGEQCFAQDGENRYHAVFDNGLCAIVHPSAMAVALTAFNATIVAHSKTGDRRIPIAEFFVKPETDVQRENTLRAGEIITEIRVPPQPRGTVSHYIKLKEKQAFDWPVADAAVVMELEGSRCRSASIVMGAAAPIPRRAAEAEKVLGGQEISRDLAAEAAEAALTGATSLRDNAYKVQMLKATVRRAILSAAGIDPLV